MPDMKYKYLKILNISLLTLLVVIGLMFYFKSPDKRNVSIAEPKLKTEKPSLPMNVDKETYEGQVTETLFGTTISHVANEPVSKTNLPEGIKLKGTITGPSDVARAILEITDKTQNKPETVILRIGETIAEEFVIKAINRDHIVLKADSAEIKLWIATEKKQTVKSPPPKTGESQIISEPVIINLPVNIAENRKLSESMNIDTQWTLAKDSDGKTIGIKLEDIKPFSPMALCGLQNGDIIKSINNQKLSNYQQTYQVLQKARVKKNIRLEVFRNRKTYEFENNLTDGD